MSQYDNVLPGQGYRRPQEVVEDECEATMDWRDKTEGTRDKPALVPSPGAEPDSPLIETNGQLPDLCHDQINVRLVKYKPYYLQLAGEQEEV
jgi:hypothetical protein